MTDEVKKVDYCYISVPNKAGEGVKMLDALRSARVNLLAFSGFPSSGGKAQLDFVTDQIGKVKKVARARKWKVSPTKKAFLIRGKDRVGVASSVLGKLATARISVTALDAVSAGKGRFGMILWVKPKSYAKAAKILGAK